MLPLAAVPLPLTPVPLAPGPLPRRQLRQVPGLELGAQPVHVGQDLAAQLPALRVLGRIGGEQAGQLVLLPVRLLEMVLEHLGDRLGGELGERPGRRLGLEQLPVGPDRGGQLGDHGGQPGPGLRLPDRTVLAVDPRAVRHRTGQHPHVRRRPLQRVDAVAQPGRRVPGPQLARVQPDALLGLGQRVVDPLDLAAQRPGPVQPFGRAPRLGRLGQALGHLGEQVGHLAAQVADRLPGRLHPDRGQHQAGREPGGRADQRLGDPAGRGGVRAAGEDQHGTDRHLEDLLAEPQHDAEHQRGRGQQAEHPPAERDVGGHRDGSKNASGDGQHPLRGAPDRVGQGGLRDQQRGQRGEHGMRRPAGQLERDQVREHGGGGQPGDVDRGRLGPPPDQRQLLGDGARGHGTNGETTNGKTLHKQDRSRHSSSREQNISNR